MRFVLRTLMTAVVAVVTPALARAQEVGTAPLQSPYEDLKVKSEIGIYAGYFLGAEGIAGVGLQNGPVVGVRYERHLSGPASVAARLGVVSANRNVIDPSKVGVDRNVGTEREEVVTFDADFLFYVNGAKTWHGLMPVILLGVGGQFDNSPPDVGGFSIGTGFSLNFGAGLRYVPSNKLTVRFDFTDNLWQLAYPSTYFLIPEGSGQPVLDSSQGNNQWTHNLTFTLGLSWVLSR